MYESNRWRRCGPNHPPGRSIRVLLDPWRRPGADPGPECREKILQIRGENPVSSLCMGSSASKISPSSGRVSVCVSARPELGRCGWRWARAALIAVLMSVRRMGLAYRVWLRRLRLACGVERQWADYSSPSHRPTTGVQHCVFSRVWSLCRIIGAARLRLGLSDSRSDVTQDGFSVRPAGYPFEPFADGESNKAIS